VSRPSTANDLLQIALSVLQPGAAPAEPPPTGSLPRRAVFEFGALLCVAAALGCSLAALWMFASPMLGAQGALLVVSAVLCAVAGGARVFDRRAQKRRPPPQAPGLALGAADDARIPGGSSLFLEHPVLTLAAALLAGVVLGWEDQAS
jgi:hypothetical protein